MTDSAQNYLKALWTLSEWSGGTVAPSEMARHLNLKPSSVSDQIRRLTNQGLVDHAPYGSVKLTDEGRSLALMMVRRHRLAETFLQQMLGYTWDEVHEDADLLEHAMTDRMLSRIDSVLGHPDRDPHGDPIPAADGTLPPAIVRTLTDAEKGESVQLVRVRDGDPSILRHLEKLGATPGEIVTVVDPGESVGVMILSSASSDNPFPLSRDIADYIRIAGVVGTVDPSH